MAQIHQAAASRGITHLFSDVSLTAEPFFTKCGFVIEVRQQVAVRGTVLANALSSTSSWPDLPMTWIRRIGRMLTI